jgi:hypothetical protein
MPLWILNILGWIKLNPFRFVLYLFAFLGLVYVVTWFACGKREVKLDDKQKVEAAKAIEQKNDAKLKEILIEVEAREATINANVETAHVETHAAIQNAKEKYANMNTSELAAELEKRK